MQAIRRRQKHRAYLEGGSSELGWELAYVTHASVSLTGSQSHVHTWEAEYYS